MSNIMSKILIETKQDWINVEPESDWGYILHS